MANVQVFHHALGLTEGLHRFAGTLRTAGHRVGAPDLFDGSQFSSIEDGVAHAEAIGFEVIAEGGLQAGRQIDEPFVVIGFSLGALPAQRLAQTHAEVRAAVLIGSAIRLGVFADNWSEDVRLQIHMVEDDPWAAEDLPAARQLTDAAGGELFLYPGTGHLVADPGSVDYDPVAADQITARILRFLDAGRAVETS